METSNLYFKYVVVKTKERAWAILSCAGVSHAAAFNPQEVTAISAGFGQVSNGQLRLWGRSTTLGLASRPEDQVIVENTLLIMGLL